MEKKELQRYIDWIVEEILMNPNQRSRQDIELMERGEFGNRTVTLVTNLINELVDKAREEGRRETLLEMQMEFSEYGVPDDVRYTHSLFYINNIIEEKLSKLKDNK